MRAAASPDLTQDQLRLIDDYQKMLAGQAVPGISLTRPAPIEEKNILTYGQQQTANTDEQLVSTESLQTMGLSANATENLRKRLEELGLTSVSIGKPVRELSSGITTVSFSAKGAGTRVMTYTAHVSKAGEILDDTQKRFRTFGSAIMRNVMEVTKWTLGSSSTRSDAIASTASPAM